MNKADLQAHLVSAADLSNRQANEVLAALFHPTTGVIAKSLKKGEKVSIAGFGTFSQGKRGARKARNPQTGATVKVSASKTAKFKAGTTLKATVNDKASKKGR